MFKNLESAWNSRTPVWLHNGTKENLIFQIGTTFVVIGVIVAHEEYKTRREIRNRNANQK